MLSNNRGLLRRWSNSAQASHGQKQPDRGSGNEEDKFLDANKHQVKEGRHQGRERRHSERARQDCHQQSHTASLPETWIH